MFIRIENDIINMDQIVWARYIPPRPQYDVMDEPTGSFWPCKCIIGFINADNETTMEFTDDQAVEAWEKLLQYGDFGEGVQ